MRLLAKFVSGEVISFAVGGGGSGVGVRRKICSSAARSWVRCGIVFSSQ